MKIHVLVWIAAATLHEEGANAFTPAQVEATVSRLFGYVPPALLTHIVSHVNASGPRNSATVYNYLTRVNRGLYRLSQAEDAVDPSRVGEPRWPVQAQVEECWWSLWRKWSTWQESGQPAAESVAPALEPIGLVSTEVDEEAAHYLLSSYREAMLEHMLLGELMRALWPTPLEVCRPQVDSAGFTLILQCRGILRHVLLKTSSVEAKRRDVSVNLELAGRHGGCVIWSRFGPSGFTFKEFLWLGGPPGQPLPDISAYRVTKHTKANAQGLKEERPSHRTVPLSAFTRLTSMAELVAYLFGATPAVTQSGGAAQLVQYIRSLSDFALRRSDFGTYKHMGAIIAESILQAGINYRHVVVPRVTAIRADFPEASTTSGFLALVNERGAGAVLNFGGDKPGRVVALTWFLKGEGVETEADLAAWLASPANRERLSRLHGIGPKTVDYMQILVGIDNSAVDRHLIAFVERAGVHAPSYGECKRVIDEAADLLGVEKAVLDHSIWRYMSDRVQR